MAFDKKNFGLIADGNRRWAHSQNLPVFSGHKKGFEVIKDIVLPALYDSSEFDTLTVYGFSTENWKRSPLEVKNLMSLYHQIMESWQEEALKKEIYFQHAGRKDRLPSTLVKKMREMEEKTKKFKKFRLILCLDYGSQDEISRAVDRGGTKFTDFLEVPPLDLILRTGGESRLSNFCLWQAAYAELNFYHKFLPELEKSDMEGILSDFLVRDRRQGK